MMRKSRILAITVTTLGLGLTGAASASAAPQSASRPPSIRAASAGSAQRAGAARLTLQRRGPGHAPTAGCGFVNAVPADRYRGLPDYTTARGAQPYLARLITSQGVIVVQALTAQAPCTTYSFRFLAQRGYFNQTHCHRLTTQGIFVLQCGDPTGTGSGGPGYQFNDENLTGATYPAGTVAMANAGPNTNGSQFFFVWKDTRLAPNYTPFGQVIGGMDVLQKVAAAGDDSQNGPGDGYPHRFTEFRHIKIILK